MREKHENRPLEVSPLIFRYFYDLFREITGKLVCSRIFRNFPDSFDRTGFSWNIIDLQFSLKKLNSQFFQRPILANFTTLTITLILEAYYRLTTVLTTSLLKPYYKLTTNLLRFPRVTTHYSNKSKWYFFSKDRFKQRIDDGEN